MTSEQIRHTRALLNRPENSTSSIARLTIYKYVPELATGRLTVDRPTAQAAPEPRS
ncbi:Hin recombinase [Nonomuraea sp. NPDC049400]|uniref:Hin recombinase n=1 Tax=Nonomuraea sp. NPDC049400 TaxID=3364352 RepID=UPI0037BBF202